MAIAALLALFPILFLFAPRLALACLALAVVLLYQKRIAGARKMATRHEPRRHEQVEWEDPWNTEGLGR